MENILQLLRRVTGTETTVLIQGETGTGKELVARFIHRESNRRDQIFIPVNCGAIPRDLVESEFFGHAKGAFTGAIQEKKGYFEMADGGTIFLDEIGEAPPELQVKLLRVIQESEIMPRRLSPAEEGGCAHHRLHQPGPESRGGSRPLPAGPLFPNQRLFGDHPAAARASQRTSCPSPTTS